MDTIRFARVDIGGELTSALPLLASLIHPLVTFWRAKGVGVTYTVVLTLVAIGMMGLFSIRHELWLPTLAPVTRSSSWEFSVWF